MQTAKERVAREEGQKWNSWISAGTSLIGAFLGRRRTRMTTVARGVGYASQQVSDVKRAEQALELLEEEKRGLEDALRDDLDALMKEYDTENIELELTEIPPRKGDLKVEDPMIVWTPWQVDSSGIASPLY